MDPALPVVTADVHAFWFEISCVFLTMEATAHVERVFVYADALHRIVAGAWFSVRGPAAGNEGGGEGGSRDVVDCSAPLGSRSAAVALSC